MAQLTKQIRFQTESWTRMAFKFGLVLIYCLFFLQCQTNKSVSKSNLADPVEKYSAPVHFSSLYADAEMKYAFKGSTHSDFEKWKKTFHSELKKLLGLNILEKQLANYQPKTKLLSSEDIGFAIREPLADLDRTNCAAALYFTSS